MNKQPFYHSADCNITDKDIARIKGHKNVIANTVEYYNRELLFTAITEVTEEELKIKTDYGFNIEPGDPADLVGVVEISDCNHIIGTTVDGRFLFETGKYNDMQKISRLFKFCSNCGENVEIIIETKCLKLHHQKQEKNTELVS